MNGRHSNYTKVSIVIPAHNEEGNIDPLTEELAKVISSMKYGVEVVYVNDGSTDRTEQKMVEAVRRYRWARIVKNRVRLGLTSALTKGFAQAKGDILVFYPADLQFHPRDIPKMIESIDNGADMVCGKKQGHYGKWLVSGIYNMMTRMLFPKLKVSDMNSVKAFTREVYNEFPTMREGWHRYLAAFAATKDYVVREVPVTLQKRHSGKSKFAGKSRILKGLTDLIAVKFQVSVFGDPMHLFGRLALWFFFIGFLIGAGAVVLRFYPVPGVISPRPLLYAVILFELAALVTFVMGIITEALVYLRDSLGEMRTQNQRLLDELARRSGVRMNAIPDDSETRHYERSDDRVDERTPEVRQEGRRPERRDTRTDSRPDSRRRDPRDSRDSRDARGPRREEPRREERREERREVKPEEAREAAPVEAPREQRPPRENRRDNRPDGRRGRDDRRPQRGDRDRRPDREPRPDNRQVAPPTENVEPPFIAAEPEVRETPTFTPEPRVEREVYVPQTPVSEPQASPEVASNEPQELDFGDKSSSEDRQPQGEQAQRHQYRSGRRARRVRPMNTPSSSSEPSGSSDANAPRQNGADIPDRPTTIKVRELPVDNDNKGEDA